MTEEAWQKHQSMQTDCIDGERFILVWKNARISKIRLGDQETVRQLERRLLRCHPTNRRPVKTQIRNAENNKGEEADDNVILKFQSQPKPLAQVSAPIRN